MVRYWPERRRYSRILPVKAVGRVMPKAEMDGVEIAPRWMGKVLRCSAAELRIPIAADGFVKIDRLIDASQRRLSTLLARELAFVIVRCEPMCRFQLWGSPYMDLSENDPPVFVRACSGHAMKCVDDKQMPWWIPPVYAQRVPVKGYHRTSMKKLGSMLEVGLLPGGLAGQHNRMFSSPLAKRDPTCGAGVRFSARVTVAVAVRGSLLCQNERDYTAGGALITPAAGRPSFILGE